MIAQLEGAGFRRARLRTPESGLTLTLTCHDAGVRDRFDERHPGMDHVSFHVDSIDDVLRMRSHLEHLGVDHSPVKEPGPGAAMITLRDPDNIQLEIFGGPLRHRSARAPGSSTD